MPAVWSQENHASWKVRFAERGWSLDSLSQKGSLWCVEVSLDRPSWALCQRRCCLDVDALKVVRSSPGVALDAALTGIQMLWTWPHRPEHPWLSEEMEVTK